MAILEKDWDRLLTFYAFPEGHWKHLCTRNVIESPSAAVRLRTDAAERFKKEYLGALQGSRPTHRQKFRM